MSRKLLADESGFIVSAELVLVATLLVIGLIVGMSEVQHAVVSELNDVADAIGSANQSYHYSGFTKRDRGWGGWGWGGGGVHAHTAGSVFVDVQDACDLNQCMLACNPPVVEAPKMGAYGFRGGFGHGGTYQRHPAVAPSPVTPPCTDCPAPASPADAVTPDATPTPVPDAPQDAGDAPQT